MTLEDSFELSATAMPLKTRSKNPETLRRKMNAEMNRQIHAIFEKMGQVVTPLPYFAISYDDKSATDEDGIIRFSIPPEKRVLSREVAKVREEMEGFLQALLYCCPDEDAMWVDDRPSTFIYDLHFNTANSLIDALYNMMDTVFESKKEEYASLFLAGHIYDRIEDYLPAHQLN